MEAESYQLNRESNSHMQKPQPKQALRCTNCDIEILWTPTVVQGKTFCCTGCAAGGPCNCDYSLFRSITISGVIHYVSDKDTPEKETGQK